MKEFFLFITSLISIAVPICFIVILIKDYRDRNKAEKQNLIEQIEQHKNTISENEAKAEQRLKEYERERISRDIKLARSFTNDHLVNIVMEYCPCKLMSAHSLNEMKRLIDEAEDDYDFDNFIKEKYLPIIGNEYFCMYKFYLRMLKSTIRLHKDLTPQEVIGQIDDFYRQNKRCNNEVELLSCVKPLNLHFEPYNDFVFFSNDEVRDIAKLITEHFDIYITENGMEDVLNPSDHSSYYRSISGISRIFARILFNSIKEYSQLGVLDDDVFDRAIDEYFFCEIYYDLKKFKTYLPEIINYVTERR